jgi:hypothetical protein
VSCAANAEYEHNAAAVDRVDSHSEIHLEDNLELSCTIHLILSYLLDMWIGKRPTQSYLKARRSRNPNSYAKIKRFEDRAKYTVQLDGQLDGFSGHSMNPRIKYLLKQVITARQKEIITAVS